MKFSTSTAFLLAGLSTALPWPLKIEKRLSPSDPSRFKTYSTINKLGVICDSDQGPDGVTLWYQDLGASIVGYVNYKTGVVKEFPIPWSNGSKQPQNTPSLNNVTTLQCVMRIGKDGNLYGGAGIRNEIIRIDPRTHPPRIRTFAPKKHDPAGNLQNFNDAWGANEVFWFSQTTADIVTSFNYRSHVFIDYPVPNRNAIPLNSPLGMRTDKHDNLWFTNFIGQYISKVDKKHNKVVEYPHCCTNLPGAPVPPPKVKTLAERDAILASRQGGNPSPPGLFPEVLRTSTQNQKYLWANAFGSGGVIRIDVDDPTDPKFKYYGNPDGLGSFPFENVNDYCGRIWYTSPTMDKVFYLDPKLGNHWTTITVPPNIAGVPGPGGSFEVTMHRGPGPYMWWTEGTTALIVRYTLDKSCHGEPA